MRDLGNCRFGDRCRFEHPNSQRDAHNYNSFASGGATGANAIPIAQPRAQPLDAMGTGNAVHMTAPNSVPSFSPPTSMAQMLPTNPAMNPYMTSASAGRGFGDSRGGKGGKGGKGSASR
jgi:hypothetical protein